jgi:hypothetical protein
MPELHISRYTTVKMPSDVGQVAHWVLKGKGARTANGVVFQQVVHRSRLGSGKIRTHRFYESWRVKDGTFLPSSGEDYFLCPLSWHVEPGAACIVARAWFYPGDFLAIMKELDMCDPESPISGVLWSNPGTVPQKYDPGAHSACRYWKATWAKTDTPGKMRLHIDSKTKTGERCEISKSCNIRKYTPKRKN